MTILSIAVFTAFIVSMVLFGGISIVLQISITILGIMASNPILPIIVITPVVVVVCLFMALGKKKTRLKQVKNTVKRQIKINGKSMQVEIKITHMAKDRDKVGTILSLADCPDHKSSHDYEKWLNDFICIHACIKAEVAVVSCQPL